MCRVARRQALWVLAALSLLAPSSADGNIGCLFSAILCVEGVEWCYDDFAFGKCIPAYQDAEDGELYRYDMGPEQLQWFEGELQRLATRGYRWEHAYTQCVLQAMLYTLKHNMNPTQFNRNICEHFADPKLLNIEELEETPQTLDIVPDETAFIRFTPNSQLSDSNFANEVYNPPMNEDPAAIDYLRGLEKLNETPSDKLRNLLMDNDEGSPGTPMVRAFEGFRERLNAEKAMKATHDKEKKSSTFTNNNANEDLGEERSSLHLRKHKNKIKPLFAENNDNTLLDKEVISNAFKNYKNSFSEKNFPFEYNELPETRFYVDEDALEYANDVGSGEIDAYPIRDSPKATAKNAENINYYVNLWNNLVGSKNKPQELYAEGGPLQVDEVNGENYFYPEEFQELFNNEWGFKRREREDVKKPGPRLDAKMLIKPKKAVTALGSPHKESVRRENMQYNYDPSYTHVKFDDKSITQWPTGVNFIAKVAQLLGLEKNVLINPRVDESEVTFNVKPNNKDLDARKVAQKIYDLKDQIQEETGLNIISTGVGNRVQQSLIGAKQSNWFLELPVLFALVGSLCVLLVGSIVFAILLKRDMNSKRKMQGLASATEIDAEATRDYQELCRARMSGKWSGQQTATAPHPTEPPQRIASLSREPEGNSPSTRSSTSSWSEEPALTNMDISTGHMVLAYMEDHLRNKDRLEQEWRALCAYEAEPCSTVAALKPENAGKNRYAGVLPYDHSRVTLNTLSNHLGSDYINASTITDHDPRNPAYIAAAGPLAHTAPDFWQMVWEQGSVVMVMLTRLTENGQGLCHRYWPEEGSELYHIYEVHLVSEHIWCDDYLVRSFYLKNQRTGETRTVTQFHFLSWPENGVPASTKALLEFRRKVNKSYRGRSCPIVVHCSDGAGRSGTYCLIDMVLNRMAKGAKEIDIAATLEHIRDQRPRTVATKQQFEFVLMAVAEEVHAILKALPAHLQQLQEKKDKDKEKEKDGTDKEKPN